MGCKHRRDRQTWCGRLHSRSEKCDGKRLLLSLCQKHGVRYRTRATQSKPTHFDLDAACFECIINTDFGLWSLSHSLAICTPLFPGMVVNADISA